MLKKIETQKIEEEIVEKEEIIEEKEKVNNETIKEEKKEEKSKKENTSLKEKKKHSKKKVILIVLAIVAIIIALAIQSMYKESPIVDITQYTTKTDIESFLESKVGEIVEEGEQDYGESGKDNSLRLKDFTIVNGMTTSEAYYRGTYDQNENVIGLYFVFGEIGQEGTDYLIDGLNEHFEESPAKAVYRYKFEEKGYKTLGSWFDNGYIVYLVEQDGSVELFYNYNNFFQDFLFNL